MTLWHHWQVETSQTARGPKEIEMLVRGTRKTEVVMMKEEEEEEKKSKKDLVD